MSERITEAELQEWAAIWSRPKPQEGGDCDALRLADDWRRLRGLIVAASAWRHASPCSGDCVWCGMREGLSDHSEECPHEFEAEARAIREEQG